MSDKQIKISCDVKNFMSYKEIKPFQGDLKSLSRENYEKLKNSIIKHGIHMPVHVWENEGVLYTIDGHQRIRTFEQMEKEGYEIPLIPIVRVTAENIKQAKKILLSTASVFGKIDTQGYYEFAELAGLEIEDLKCFDLPGINIEKFEDEFYEQELDSQDDKAEVFEIKIICDSKDQKDSMLALLGLNNDKVTYNFMCKVVEHIKVGTKI